MKPCITFRNPAGSVNTTIRVRDPDVPEAVMTILLPLVGHGVGFTHSEVGILRDFLNHHFPKETE